MQILIIVFVIIVSFIFLPVDGDAACKYPDIQLCIDDDDTAPVFDYEPKPKKKKIVKKIARKKNPNAKKLDQTTFFAKGEINKEVELMKVTENLRAITASEKQALSDAPSLGSNYAFNEQYGPLIEDDIAIVEPDFSQIRYLDPSRSKNQHGKMALIASSAIDPSAMATDVLQVASNRHLVFDATHAPVLKINPAQRVAVAPNFRDKVLINQPTRKANQRLAPDSTGTRTQSLSQPHKNGEQEHREHVKSPNNAGDSKVAVAASSNNRHQKSVAVENRLVDLSGANKWAQNLSARLMEVKASASVVLDKVQAKYVQFKEEVVLERYNQAKKWLKGLFN